jgi:phosphoglycerate dehydrogenase-like enzyme
MTRIAVIDDWQHVARHSADWTPLESRAEVVFFHEPLGTPREIVAVLAGFDAILAMRERTIFTPEIIAGLPRLKFFNMTGKRARGLDDLARAGVTISTTSGDGGDGGEDTAEHALALLLAAVRHVPAGDSAIRAGRFQQGVEPGFRLAGKTLGILGLGRIGGQLAGYARALGMEVLAWSRSMTPEKAAAAGVEAVSRDDLYARSHVLSIHLVLSDETRGMVDTAAFARMRHGAVLVNTSRAPIVAEPALLAALNERRIHAALDVFMEEPLPPGHPLITAPNTVLTPHLGYGTLEAYAAFYRASIENALAFLDGKPMRLIRDGRLPAPGAGRRFDQTGSALPQLRREAHQYGADFERLKLDRQHRTIDRQGFQRMLDRIGRHRRSRRYGERHGSLGR